MDYELFSHNKADNLVSFIIKENILRIISSTNLYKNTAFAKNLRYTLLSKLKEAGWSNDFKLDLYSQITLTAFNDDHVLCLQTGNMSRFYADLLKLQYVYINKKAKAAFYIIPSKETAKNMGSNIAHFDRFIFELELFKEIVTIPILVIGVK